MEFMKQILNLFIITSMRVRKADSGVAFVKIIIAGNLTDMFPVKIVHILLNISFDFLS